MKARDIMSTPVITVNTDTPISEIAQRLLDHRISAVPVLDGDGQLAGIVSEGDLMRREELGTEPRQSWWLRLFGSDHTGIQDYLRSHGRTARDVMTAKVISVTEETGIGELASLLERHRIKRVPVLRDKLVVGIVSRANLAQALATQESRLPEPPRSEQALRARVLDSLHEVPGTSHALNVIVEGEIVHVWGGAASEAERKALRVAAENAVAGRTLDFHVEVLPAYMYGSGWV